MQAINISIIGKKEVVLPGVQLSEMLIERDLYKQENVFDRNHNFALNENSTETTLEVNGIIPHESAQKQLHLHSTSQHPFQISIDFNKSYKISGSSFITYFQLIDNGKNLPNFTMNLQLFNISFN